MNFSRELFEIMMGQCIDNGIDLSIISNAWKNWKNAGKLGRKQPFKHGSEKKSYMPILHDNSTNEKTINNEDNFYLYYQ